MKPFGIPKTVHYEVRSPRWRNRLPLKIVALADIHISRLSGLGYLRRLVRQTVALGPDLIVLLGDYDATYAIPGFRIPPADWAGELGRLRAPLGTFAVLGNHDWDRERRSAVNALSTAAAQAITDAGIPLLENRAVALEHHGSSFYLAGLGSQRTEQRLYASRPFRRWTGTDDWPAIDAQTPGDIPLILLAHEPDIFPELPEKVTLMLSGHTHGGQVLVGRRALIVPSRHGRRYAHGRFDEAGRTLIVSAGLGESGLPIRFGISREIVVVEVSSTQRLAA